MQERRNIVITGVTRGLGRAMAESFLEAGHTVSGCGRSSDDILALQTAFPEQGCFEQIDVGEDLEVSAWAERVVAEQGAPDILINNAATINRNAPLWNISSEEFNRVIHININGMANCIRHFVPPMIQRGTGVIVNFSSGWGRSTSAEVAPYCATKWAVEGMTLSLAQELPEGLAAVPLNPGIINTSMLQSCFGESANGFPVPAQWSLQAVPFILNLNTSHNGQSLTVPG